MTVPAGVTLTVTGYTGGGALEKLGAGKLVICDNLANWSVVCDWPYGVKLAVVDKTLCAIPNPSGMSVIIR